MITLSINEDYTRKFMNDLLKSDLFDNFEVRLLIVEMSFKLEIDGTLLKKDQDTNFCLWKDLRVILTSIIKSTNIPSYIKIVFSCPEKKVLNIHENAKALFLNFTYKNNRANFVTGTQQINFSLDKDLENLWDENIVLFLKKNELQFEVD